MDNVIYFIMIPKDVVPCAADAFQLRVPDLSAPGFRIDPPEFDEIVPLCHRRLGTFATDGPFGEREVAQRARVRPVLIELVLERGDDRPLNFHHPVVPLIPVFASEVHPANVGIASVDEEHFRVSELRNGLRNGRTCTRESAVRWRLMDLGGTNPVGMGVAGGDLPDARELLWS